LARGKSGRGSSSEQRARTAVLLLSLHLRALRICFFLAVAPFKQPLVL
jgi:hypothetical protein